MLLSVIIVNFNSREQVLTLISDLRKSILCIDYEIIVVDNGSTDGSSEVFAKMALESSNLHYFYDRTNLGFGVACNIGARKAQGDIFLFLNPDIRIPSSGLDIFVLKGLTRDTGVLAPRLVYPDGSVQPNGGGYATLITYVLQFLKLGYLSRKLNLTSILVGISSRVPFLKNSIIGKYLRNFDAEESEVVSYDWVSGAFMVIKKSLFELVGGFDERFFMYDEDEDLCRRIVRFGFEVNVDKSFTVVHNGKGTQRAGKARLTRADKERLKSNIYYLSKYASRLSAEILRGITIIYLIYKLGIEFIFDRKAVRGHIGWIAEILRYRIHGDTKSL